MKKIVLFLIMILSINVISYSNVPKKKSKKHPSHKVSKKKRSKYFFNFQH
jgi:uncharacterized membrane protein